MFRPSSAPLTSEKHNSLSTARTSMVKVVGSPCSAAALCTNRGPGPGVAETRNVCIFAIASSTAEQKHAQIFEYPGRTPPWKTATLFRERAWFFVCVCFCSDGKELYKWRIRIFETSQGSPKVLNFARVKGAVLME